MSALEKFKRRLVRDIARRQYVEGQPEDEMWDQLKTEYGCDCFLLWQHMKVLTSKKLKRMLAAEDRMECITRVARMTSTDWLTFDLVLVHQDVDVIGEELIQSGKPESSVLEQLFELVVMYNIENSSEETLVVRWASLTQMYNTGGRACSAMLLQRRWYQLKDLSRRRFYDFWQMYRGNPRNLPKAVRPTKLQIRISEKFPKLITERLVLWKDLLDSGKIVKAAQFENRRRRMESNTNNDDPDLVVIEPHVETIEVNADSEDENELAKVIKDTEINENTQDSITQQAMEVDNQFKDISNTAENSPGPFENSNVSNSTNCNVRVKTEPTEVLELNDTLSDDEPMEIDHIEDTEENIAPEHVENDSKCSINDTVLPKITNIMGNVNIESNEECNTINQGTVDEISDFEDSQIESDVAPSVICEDSQTLEGNVQQKLPFSSEDVIDMNELPPTLKFVDDGIEFVDDEEDSPEVEKPGDDGDEFVNLDEVDPSYNIDRKLLMIPISYTKKLDDMNILKNSGYSTVKGNYLIELIEAESRTIKMNAVEIKTEVISENDQTDVTANNDNGKVTEDQVTEQINKEKGQDFSQLNEQTETKKAVSKDEIKVKTEIESINDDDSEKCEVPRVKFTSWLLQKPKHRNYNSIQLCKNPDFNTRLKRVSVGFFLSERNRRLFNACKPLTIDMHKAFESKLVDNVLYLENTTIPTLKQEKVAQEKVATECENTVSVIPSAVAVQSLLDISRVESTHKDDLPEKLETSESKPLPGHISERKDDHVIERGHVINKPLISPQTPTQSANEDLLRAEVNPVAPTPVSENRPPTQVEETSLNTSHNPVHDKKNKKAKPKPPPSVPQWSKSWANLVQYEESLITKDTLDKVIFLLDTGMFQLPKKVPLAETAKRPTTREAIPLPSSTKETSNQEIVTNTDEANNLSTYEDEFIRAQNQIWENYQKNCSKKKRYKSRRTIASGSGFCCWSRHKIEYMRPENQNVTSIKNKKYRHLCPLSEDECYCCCLQDLRNTRRKSVDHTYSRDGEPPHGGKVHEKRVIVIRDVSIQAKSIQNEYGEVEIKSAIELYHPRNKNISENEQGAAALDAVGDDSDNSATDPDRTYPVSHSSVSTQSENNDVIVKQLTHVSNTSDISIDSDNETPPVIKTNIIPATQHRGNKAELFSVTASAGWPATSSTETNQTCVQKATSLNQQQYIAETISLIEEEADAHPHQTSFSPPKGLLPQGVNILLLPDNTLSVSIEPGVQIDPASLSKLPEILSAVQNKLLVSRVLKKPRKIPIKKWKYPNRRNTEINTTSRNVMLNQPIIINLDHQINTVHGNLEVNVNNDIDILQENGELELNTEVNVTEGNAELTAMSPEVQVTEESAQLRILTPEVENAELIAMNPKVSLAKENTELHPVSPDVYVMEDTAELTVINPDLPVAKEKTKLDLMNPEIHFSEDTAELIVMSAAKVNDDLHNMNSEENVDAGDAEVNSKLVVNSGSVNVNVVNAEVSVFQENTGLLQDSNTNPDLNTGQTNSMLNCASTGENIGKDNEDTPIYTDYVVKVAPEANRKTILSDLMTMSGISPEDTNTTTEYPVVNNIIGNHVLNYNLPDNPYYLTNTHNVGGNIQILPPPKKVKKVMVFIKKRIKNKPTPDGSIIDLTDDNDKPVDTSKQNEPQTDNIQKQENDSKKLLNLKRAKLIRVPAAAVPLKIFQAAQSLLKKDNSVPSYNNTNMSSTDIEKQMKIHVARHYRQLNRKPSILDILRNIKNSKALQANEKIRSESESSDDEPLAKKSRRMRIENSDSNDSNAVVPVEQYNLPVEYHTEEQEPMLVSAADDEDYHTDSDTNTDAEESSILGI